jgi:hypothetical protein
MKSRKEEHMTLAYRQRLALLLTTSLATLLVALALASTSASASSFCNGQTINNHQTCFAGGARSFEWIRGHGDSTGVCVGYNETFLACSPGAGWYAEYRFYYYIYAIPKISGNSPNNTVGYGETL